MTERREHTVQARDRQFKFMGVLLAEASSQRDDKPRWSEVQIFKTIDGEYVVAGVGRSRVEGEDDMHWAHVCDSPAAAVEQLHQYDRDGVRYITALAKRAITEAGREDPELLDAFLVENITP